MAGGGLKLLVALAVLSVAGGGTWVGAQVDHVVGGDDGWNPSSNMGSWSSGRVFRVGDKIWFTNSQGQENIVEVETIEEYMSCNVTNPIRMYTGGLDKVSLDEEGVRYFTSGNLESCKSGLKLHVHVQPQMAVATSLPNPPLFPNPPSLPTPPSFPTPPPPPPPTPPSTSARLSSLSYMMIAGLFLCFMGL